MEAPPIPGAIGTDRRRSAPIATWRSSRRAEQEIE
jgi:hypothetical protein